MSVDMYIYIACAYAPHTQSHCFCADVLRLHSGNDLGPAGGLAVSTALASLTGLEVAWLM
jgi:hypothetical protein